MKFRRAHNFTPQKCIRATAIRNLGSRGQLDAYQKIYVSMPEIA